MKLKREVVWLAAALAASCNVAVASNVKVTPIGQRTGEFCAQDRALLFEDPTGVRVLYDPGNTVAGAADSRLGSVHVILISHAHSDHLGNAKLNQDPNSSLAVINMGDIFTTGPEEAAFAVTDLIRPTSVIPSHVNEVATQGGMAVSGSRTARFLDLLSKGSNGHGSNDNRQGHGSVSVLLPLSGATMEFDGSGRCQAGCQGR